LIIYYWQVIFGRMAMASTRWLTVRVADAVVATSAIDKVGTDEAIDVPLQLASPPSRIISAVAFHRGDTGITLIGMGPGADAGTEIRANAWRQMAPLAASGQLTLPVAKTLAVTEDATAHAELPEGHPRRRQADPGA
jgi:NADPH:quinone reductase-like Zn-dependent oxidoreductase